MSLLNKLKFTESQVLGQAGQLVDNFERELKDRLSTTFRSFCEIYGGGYLSDENSWFVPNARHRSYWKLCERRQTDPGGQIEITTLYGITDDKRFDISQRTSNTWRVWNLPKDFWVVASDGMGKNIVSGLRESSDEVYYWEPHIEPNFFKVSDSLTDFYNSLHAVPEDVFEDE